ncbi:MAG TPA: monofunctional biosynthetic peptidoglycan transglycosylase [Desulfarculaceae bacterium]|nr:monofunctional biosynthetic peptidoglycan transglycosylase [Desulfarculaceae bacterium]
MTMARRRKKSKNLSKLRNYCLLLLLLIVLLTGLQVFVFGYVKPPLTISRAHSWINHTFMRGSRPRAGQWVPLAGFSPDLRRAVIASEDQRFLSHHGFDFIELGQALRSLREGGYLRGASTITMQTARTMFLCPARNWGRKLAEAYYTLLLEIIWSKEKILEFYLNSVDWGPGLIGAEAASIRYFHCRALELNREQAAHLAAVLPGPHLWRPDRPSAAVKRRVERILKEIPKVALVGDRLED